MVWALIELWSSRLSICVHICQECQNIRPCPEQTIFSLVIRNICMLQVTRKNFPHKAKSDRAHATKHKFFSREWKICGPSSKKNIPERKSTLVIMPLSQESKEKVHYSAGNCSKGSYAEHSCAFIPETLSSFVFSAHTLAHIKYSLPSPPRLVVCSTLQQNSWKKEEKSQPIWWFFPTLFHWCSGALLSVCSPGHRRHLVLLWHWVIQFLIDWS